MFCCKRCGKCCSNLLPLSNEEIKEIKRIIKKRKLKPINNIFNIDYKEICPFLNGNECIIYENRPEICKSFTCERFKNKDYKNAEKLLNKPRKLIDLRKELFEED